MILNILARLDLTPRHFVASSTGATLSIDIRLCCDARRGELCVDRLRVAVEILEVACRSAPCAAAS
jgi:hypothetical protein